jgi:hypothetical protein
MSHGIAISNQGDDVLDTTIANMRFISLYGALKIYSKGTLSLTTDSSGNATASAAHNMGYAPGVFVYRKATARYDFLSGSTEYTNAYFPIGTYNDYVKDDTLHHAIHAYADEDNVYVQVSGGKASTAMNFTYVLFVDQSESFSTADGITTDTYGLKIAKTAIDVKTAYEYQLRFSSQYKILQFHNVSKKVETITFDRIFASVLDTNVEQGSYVDFNHGLGYPPIVFPFGIAGATGDRLVKLPYMAQNSIGAPGTIISYFIDSTRIRVYWYRQSMYSALPLDLPDDTLTIKVLPFTEDLSDA